MIPKDPTITLDVEASASPEAAGDWKFYHWGHCLHVEGDDGKEYWIDCNLAAFGSKGAFAEMGFGATDMWMLAVRTERGRVLQSTTSIYKIADFKPGSDISFNPFPENSLELTRSDAEVVVSLPGCRVVCRDNNTWHVTIDDKANDRVLEFVHTGVGYPFWYGKDEPHTFTPHTIGWGYFMAGKVEGTLTTGGVTVAFKGKGVRERCWIQDQSMAEVGAYGDEIWFHFDEMHGVVYDVRFSKQKNMSLYLVEEGEYYPDGTFTIEHHDWAYLRPLRTFIPTRFRVIVETHGGTLEFFAKVVGCNVFGGEGTAPDIPTWVIDFDHLVGTFTYKDGRKKQLTNGIGGNAGQQWRAYPSVFAPDIFSEDAPVIPTLD